MVDGLDRRAFLATSAAGAMIGLSHEERALLAAVGPGGTKNANGGSEAKRSKKVGPPKATCAMGRIGDVKISRILCGGNLISGYAHSRDLIYLSPLMKHYFTDEKILDTWQVCEEHGINTCVIFCGDLRAMELIRRYHKERGGKMQWLAQANPSTDDVKTVADKALDDGAVGVFLVGNQGDRWVFDDRLDLIDKFVRYVKRQGVIAGVAGHSLQMVIAVESAGIPVDFYFKTLHHTNYWSARRPDQTAHVVDNYGADNYWAMTPTETIEFMREVDKPWIAYKVLAAGAIHPRDGFDYAFKNGADFACVGMFEWQVAEDVELANTIVARHEKRPRRWMA